MSKGFVLARTAKRERLADFLKVGEAVRYLAPGYHYEQNLQPYGFRDLSCSFRAPFLSWGRFKKYMLVIACNTNRIV